MVKDGEGDLAEALLGRAAALIEGHELYMGGSPKRVHAACRVPQTGTALSVSAIRAPNARPEHRVSSSGPERGTALPCARRRPERAIGAGSDSTYDSARRRPMCLIGRA
jgi:hypothetical protein